MRILYLCADPGVPVLGRKGASVHVRALVSALRRQGHSVVLAAATLTKSPWEEPAAIDVPILHLRRSAVAADAVAAVKRLIDTVGATSTLPAELGRILVNDGVASFLLERFARDVPDLVYERASVYATAGATVARELGVPHVVELNAPLALEQETYRSGGLGDLAREAERWLLSQADAVLPVSELLRDHVLALGVSPASVRVVPNAVDTSLFQPGPRDPTVRRALGLDDGPVLGFVGGLRPWHGVDALPELLARLADRHPDVQLLVAGSGPLAGPLRGELEARGQRKRAVFTGSVAHEDIPGLLRETDIALAPYGPQEHAFYFSPLKLFEYLACGIPVVAARVGQVADAVRDGEAGLLYEAGDREGLLGACERLLGDEPLRLRLGAAAAQAGRARSWEANARTVTEVAAHALTARRAA